ncbi:hypothetical protein L9F63_001247 [Diploptera punctata]|uniref:Hermansky-Pudlak syndrome 1 n=1 Tax=Diploptera punctata TaxID=6984 RepID=A0AAD8A5A1_DIPPU|nr:hypothetical protein L9F63_001247 [Diploptera punctata]
MKCIMIFDNLNDIVYSKYDKKFCKHMRRVGKEHNFVLDEKEDDELDADVLMQMFSVLVASHRIMSCEFGNSYTSVQCDGGANIVFDEFRDYTSIINSVNTVSSMQQNLAVCVALTKHLCGPHINMLKRNKPRAMLLSRLLDTWCQLKDCDQAFLVEAVEQLMVNDDLTSASLKALQDAVDKLKTVTEFNRIHAMLLVENKFLSLFSSKGSQELSASDIMFASVLCEALFLPPAGCDAGTESEESSGDEFYSPQSSPQHSPAQIRKEYHDLQLDGDCSDGVMSQLAVLTSADTTYIPTVIHISSIVDGVLLLLIFELLNFHYAVSCGLHESLQAVNGFLNTPQKEIDLLKYAFDNIEVGIKKILDGLKKTRHLPAQLENCHRKLQSKWEYTRRKYQEFVKTSDNQSYLILESSVMQLRDLFKNLAQVSFFDSAAMSVGRDAVLAVAGTVQHRLGSLTINKYLEEFPGLVHFVYIDRTNHRITAPSLDFNSEETTSLTKRKIWAMVDFARSHLQEGQTAVMWKDTTFNYAYFLWFEDGSAAPMKPKVSPAIAVKSFPRPGILRGDFYKKLVDVCFPKSSPYKIHVYELYCIHLGLATSTCVLEQSRRLAATIWEVTGMPTNPLDLL